MAGSAQFSYTQHGTDMHAHTQTHMQTSLEPRLYVPDFVSQLWRKIGGKAWKDLARDTVAP